jgi:hypothetical protein
MGTATIPRTRLLAPRTGALVSGIAGLVGDGLLVLFFALADPYSAGSSGWAWTGPAADAAIVVQLVALAPAVWALRTRLPGSRAMRIGTAAAVVALLVDAVLQILLIVELLPFGVEVTLGAVPFVVVAGWLFGVSLDAHRSRALPRPVTRAGLLVGAAFGLGTALAVLGLITPVPVRPLLLGAGTGLGILGWLSLSVYPLLLARYVFPREHVPHPRVRERGNLPRRRDERIRLR